MSAKFCTKCGATLQPGAKFCNGCGAPAPVTQEVLEPVAPAPIAPTPVTPPPPPSPAPPPPPAPKEPKVKVKPGTGAYLGYLLLTGIPGLGLIFAILLSLGKKPGAMKNFARAMIFYNIVLTALAVAVLVSWFDLRNILVELGYGVKFLGLF